MYDKNNEGELIGWQEVYHDDFCLIKVDPLKAGIYHHFPCLPPVREFLSDSMEVVLDLAGRWSEIGKPVIYFIEVLEGQILPSEDVTWIRNDLIPKLVEAGIRYVVYLSRNNLFRNFNHESIIDAAKCKFLVIRIFKESSDAWQWIEQLDSSFRETSKVTSHDRN